MFCDFLCPVFSASRVQHVSDLLRIGEVKRQKEEETTGQKYNGLPYSIGRP